MEQSLRGIHRRLLPTSTAPIKRAKPTDPERTADTWSSYDVLTLMRLGSALGGLASLGLHGRRSTGGRA